MTDSNVENILDSLSVMDGVSMRSARTGLSTQKDGGRMVLEKKVGLMGAIGLVVGTIIGSGIFISPKGVAENAGSVGLSLLLWGIGGIFTMFGALCMAELGTLIQTSGGEYTYIRLALADWLAYIWAWTQCLLLRPSSNAVMILTCSEYILTPIFQDGCGEPPLFNKRLMAGILSLLICAINIASVRLASGIQIIFTIAKTLALVIIVIGGIVKLTQGFTDNLATGFEGSNDNAGEIIMAFYSAMFAYNGWTNLNAVTEEVINPAWTLPMSMYIGIPLIIVLYMMANVSYFTVMTLDELLASPAVAMTWAQRVIPGIPGLIPLFVAMSTFGASNGTTFTIGRLFYTAAKGGHMMKVLSYIHVRNVTPMPALILASFFTIVYTLLGSVSQLIDFLSFAIWMFYALTMVTMIVMRYKEPYKSMERPYKAPLVFAYMVLIFAVVLVVVPLILAPQIEFLYATVIMLAGFIFYFPFVFFKVRVPCMKHVTMFFQLFFEIVPPADEEEDFLKDYPEFVKKED